MVALVSTAVGAASPRHSRASSTGPTSMGATLSTGLCSTPSTQATWLAGSASTWSRSPVRWPVDCWARALRAGSACSAWRKRARQPADPFPQQGQNPDHLIVQWLVQAQPPPGLQHRRQPAAAVLHRLGDGRLVDHRAGVAGQGEEPTGRQFQAQAGRGHIFQLVRLVEDDHVVIGQHGATRGQMGGVQVGVDHDDVGHRRPLPGRLGEAHVARRAVGRARALGRRHADRGPRRWAGFERKIGPVAGLGRDRPLQQPADLAAEGAQLGAVPAVALRAPPTGPTGRRLPPPPWPAGGTGSSIDPSARRTTGAYRAVRPPAADPCWPAGPAAPWWRSPLPPGSPTAVPAPDRRGFSPSLSGHRR